MKTADKTKPKAKKTPIRRRTLKDVSIGTTMKDEFYDIQLDTVKDLTVIEPDEILEPDKDYLNEEDQGPPGMVKCMLCGKYFKFISSTHLAKSHNTTTAKYMDRFPGIPMAGKLPVEELPVEQFTYIDVHGKIRYRDTHRIVEEDEIIKKFDISKFEEMENEFKYLAMHKSKRVIEWLETTYKDKTIALVNRLTAAKLLLEYGPSKAAQRKETSTTIKKMEIQIRGTLPQGLKIEDF